MCPQPQKWNELYELLANKSSKRGGCEPALLLILAAREDTPYISKMLRLREHLEWPDKHNCLDEVYQFLKNLDEKDWLHTGE